MYCSSGKLNLINCMTLLFSLIAREIALILFHFTTRDLSGVGVGRVEFYVLISDLICNALKFI